MDKHTKKGSRDGVLLSIRVLKEMLAEEAKSGSSERSRGIAIALGLLQSFSDAIAEKGVE